MQITKDLNGEELKLIKNTYAKGLSFDEFNLFIQVAKSRQLNPITGQIIPVVYGKGDKRKVSFQITVDGQRCIANRMNNYRPSEEPAQIIYREDLKDSKLNPLGIERVVYYAHKQDSKTGEWFKVAGEAYWEEYAPLKEAWAYNKEKGKEQPTGEFELQAGNWKKMPRVMLTKCAEMQALRKGWAEDFGGLYAPEEMEAADNTTLANDKIASYEEERRKQKAAVLDNAVLIQFNAGEELQQIPYGEVFDKVMQFVEKAESPTQIEAFKRINSMPLKTYWSKQKGDALELNKQIEKKYNDLIKQQEVKEA